MADDLEQRLAAAAEAAREHELTTRRAQEMRERMEALELHLADVRKWHAREQKDVARLEGLSLTRILVALRGSRDDDLARERAEADAAAYRVAEAQARLDTVRRELEAAQARRAQENVERSLHLVRDVHARLKQRAGTAQGRLEGIETERRRLLSAAG